MFFRIARPPADALDLANLTPGDFVQARKQADVLGIGADTKRIAAMLADISRGKPERAAAIGFMTG